ncbi:MAG: DUF2851 family protein [Clostridiales bacterium]|nr:DUF2851 family protein [Clostridiales bacterium]
MEKVMQYLWQHKLQITPGMRTTDGRRLQVIDPGRLNSDSGPDFFNAKIRIDGELWIGNIEIHVRASDWYRHGHDKDRAYDSVILHVVGVDDRPVQVANGRVLPQVAMPCNPAFGQQYSALVGMSRDMNIPCHTVLRSMPSLKICDWLAAMGHERLHMKVDRVINMLHAMAGDWEETAYITIARALGFSTNSEPFERLARSMPLRYMRKHRDDVVMIESMLFGQSGLLDTVPEGNLYGKKLIDEYRFLASKFELRQPGIQWKMSRMRPANLPHRRIALLARIITGNSSLLAGILSIGNLEQAKSFFNRQLDGYWRQSFTFKNYTGDEAGSPVALSHTSVESLIINVVAPLSYAWGQVRGDYKSMDRATELLQSLPPEHNRLTSPFENVGVKLSSALESQALIQVRSRYCEESKCLYCRVGHEMLREAARYKGATG